MAQPARSSIVLTSFSPSFTSIGSVTPSIVCSSSCDAELDALGVLLRLDLGEVVARARLDLLGGVLVEALDGGELVRLDEGEFLHRAKALGGEQLAHHLVEVERAP